MNKVRRKALNELKEQLEVLMEELESLRDEEQEAMDNMPESLQGSDRYQMMEDAKLRQPLSE